MSIIIKSGDSADLAHVSTESALRVSLDSVNDADLAGYVRILDSSGSEILTTENGALDVSLDSLVFFEQVDGSALNTNLWSTSASTMTIAQSAGFITLNSGAVTTASTYAILQSIKLLPMYGHLPLKITFNAKVNVQPQSNATIELGIGTATTTSAPTDGIFFRWNSVGEFRGVINNGGTETSTDALTAPASSDVTLFDIIVVEDLVQFIIDDEIVAQINVPIALAYPTNAGRQQLYGRVYTSGSQPAQAPQLSIGQVIAVQQATNQNKSWTETLTSLGKGSYQNPITTYGQLANHANSTSPSSATLSNTAAGYTTLGGRWQFAAVAGAATDYALFGYQVPSGYQLSIKGMRISAINTGAAVLVTPTILDWSIGINASAVSLATADGAGTWAPRRIPLGLQSFLVGDLIGKTANDIVVSFDAPVVVDSGRFLHIILQMPVGTATASQVIRGDVTLNGYFE